LESRADYVITGGKSCCLKIWEVKDVFGEHVQSKTRNEEQVALVKEIDMDGTIVAASFGADGRMV
jgi:hypothetical protein